MIFDQKRVKGTILVKVVYIIAGIIGYLSTIPFSESNLLMRSAIADIVATVVVFLFSHRLKNSSLYDPYWSVVPMWLIVWWLIECGTAGLTTCDWLMIGAVFFWGTRLTLNWWTGWKGMDHEDWRYVDLKEKHGRLYPLVNLGGIHLLPTVLVFLGCIPIFQVIQLQGTSESSGVLAWICIVWTFGAVFIEGIADYQRRVKYDHKGGPIYRSGLWAWSRHPNYFGEVMFWLGLCFYAWFVHGFQIWTGIGAAAMMLLFYFISIPMMEERQIANKPEYSKYRDEVSMLIPWPPRMKDRN